MAGRIAVAFLRPSTRGRLPTDPYLIAQFRGGASEALRTACVSLLDRGLLVAENDSLVAVGPPVSLRPIERALVKLYQRPGLPRDMDRDSACAASEGANT